MSRFVVAIPVFNERAYVRGVVQQVRQYASDILLIDDGSTDGTTAVIRRIPDSYKIFHRTNSGYGRALMSAFEFAIGGGYDWLITMDCDEQHEPGYIPRFLEAVTDDVDIISGSRYLSASGADGQPPVDRRRINRYVTDLLNQVLNLELTDAFCGFKAYRTAALRRLAIDVPGYAMPLQLWVQAAELGLVIREIPVRLIYKDPDRHFGGSLDDPTLRLEHYLDVLCRELKKSQRIRPGALALLGTLGCS